MFYPKLIWVFLFVRTKCSEVLDATSQQGIYTSDYCPISEYCPEGTHILCMFYNPQINAMRLGPKCGREARLLTMTDTLAEWVLALINQFRANVARGEEIGKKNNPLPRGYGITRVKWDNELATLAQLWANQCTARSNFCHATRRFPEQGQMTGFKRFRYPDWERLSANGTVKTRVIFEPVLNISKEVDAVTAIFRLAQLLKSEVTSQIISNYSEILVREYEKDGAVYTVRNYLEIISNWTTHIGCGMVSYAQFAGHLPSHPAGAVNVIQLVCNFGGKPIVGRPVYETDKPTDEGYSPKCGCPPGYYEDANCLCNDASTNSNEDDIEKMSETCSHLEPDCKPSVVLLPIFSIENAPPDKLYNTRKIGDQKETRRDVRKRYFNKDVTPERGYRKGGSPADGAGHVSANMTPSSTMRESLFTRVSKFQLPVKHKHENVNGLLTNNYTVNDKTDKTVKGITARKDFSNVQELVKIYQNKQHNKIPTLSPTHHENMVTANVEQLVRSIDLKSQTNLQDHDIHVTTKSFDVKNSSEKDDQLLSLLDNLEQKVKYSELNVSTKEIVDAKIRKIYGHVVGGSDNLLTNKRTKNQRRLNYDIEKTTRKSNIKFIDRDNVLSSSEDEHAIVGTHIPALTRPYKESQESFKMEVNPSYERYKTKQNVFDRHNTDLTRRLKGSQESFNLYNKPRFEKYKTKHGMYDTDDEDLTRPLKTSQESFELFDKPRLERKTKHSVSNIPTSDTDDTDDDRRHDYFRGIHDFNNNDDIYEPVDKVRHRNYYSDDEDEMFGDERKKYYQKRPSKKDRKRNRNRNEWYNDHYDRPVITSRDDLKKPYSPKRTRIRGF